MNEATEEFYRFPPELSILEYIHIKPVRLFLSISALCPS